MQFWSQIGFIKMFGLDFGAKKVKGQGHIRRMHNLRRQPVEFHLVDLAFVSVGLNFSYCFIVPVFRV